MDSAFVALIAERLCCLNRNDGAVCGRATVRAFVIFVLGVDLALGAQTALFKTWDTDAHGFLQRAVLSAQTVQMRYFQNSSCLVVFLQVLQYLFTFVPSCLMLHLTENQVVQLMFQGGEAWRNDDDRSLNRTGASAGTLGDWRTATDGLGNVAGE